MRGGESKKAYITVHAILGENSEREEGTFLIKNNNDVTSGHMSQSV